MVKMPHHRRMPKEVKGGATKEGRRGRTREGETDWTKWKRGELSTFYPGVRRKDGGTDRGTEGVRETFVARKRTRSSVGVVGARRQAAHARGGRRGGGDFRPSDGQIQNEEEERRERRDETRRTDGRTGRDRRRETVAQSGRLIRLGSRGRF